MLYPESAIKVLHMNDLAPQTLSFPLHWHERMEFIYIRSGSLNCSVDDRSLVLTPGQLLTVCPCRPHGAFSGENGASYDTVMFNIPDFYNQSNASARFLAPIADSTVQFELITDSPEVIGVFNDIVRLDSSADSLSALEATGAVYRMIAALYRNSLIKKPIAKSSDLRFDKVFKYISAHITEPLSVAELSRRFGYNEAYFCRRFKELAGISATHYIRILRLELARDLLNKQLPVGEAAIRCGFCSISRFSNSFKQHFGISPTEFIKRNR